MTPRDRTCEEPIMRVQVYNSLLGAEGSWNGLTKFKMGKTALLRLGVAPFPEPGLILNYFKIGNYAKIST